MAVELATAYVSLTASGRGLGDSISKELDGPLSKAGRDAGDRAADGFGQGFKKVAALAAGTLGAVAVGNFAKDAIGEASDLQESLSKVQVVFGENSAAVKAFAKDAAEGLGQSQQQALEAAGTFGNLFVALGIGGKPAADMSKELVTLASDLASFNNIDVDEALIALRSGLVGETEPLRRLGVNMNDATLRAEALKQGLIASTKDALTPAVKAQAAYALILAQTTTAQGDFERTSDGLANKQRILGAQFTDLKARIGSALLPIMLRLATFASQTLLPVLGRLGQKVGPIVQQIARFVGGLFNAFKVLTGDDGPQGFAEIMDSLLGNSGKYVAFFRELGETILDIAGFVKRNLRPILIALGATFVALTSPITGLVAAFVLAYTKSETFREVVQAVARFFATKVVPAIVDGVKLISDVFGDLVDWVRKVWPDIEEAITHVVNVVRRVIEVFVRVVGEVWRRWGDEILDVAKIAFGYVRSTIENVLQVIRGIIQTFLALINGDWGKAWDGLAQVVGGIWDQIKNIVSTGVGLVRTAFEGALSGLRAVWDGVWAGMEAVAGGVIDFLRGAWNAFASFFNALDFSLPKIHIPGTNIDVGGVTIGLPDLPILTDPRTGGGGGGAGALHLAGGFDGIIDRPTWMQVGEAGSEYVRVVPHAATMRMQAAERTRGAVGDRVGVGRAAPLIDGNVTLQTSAPFSTDPVGDLVRELSWLSETGRFEPVR